MASIRERPELNGVSVRSKTRAAVLLVVIAAVAAARPLPADAVSPDVDAGEVRLLPSGEGLPFDPGRYRDFGDYVRQTRETLGCYKVYMEPGRAGTELAAAMPFERVPAGGCLSSERRRPERGILLLHGLSDMPLAMGDLADAFVARCFLVRAMLLPGHGAGAGDLLDVTRGDWMAAARFGLRTLCSAGTGFAGASRTATGS